MKNNEYKCELCQNVYRKGQSAEEQEAEMKALWGDPPMEERAIVCDYCFQKIHPFRDENAEFYNKLKSTAK